mmetsp:Transcript_10742/g.19587  ORF Transcript_10742/g.19587 Transcript_10742/m.19587 type:complete len:173 (-) Transcript_10742:107-625(-)
MASDFRSWSSFWLGMLVTALYGGYIRASAFPTDYQRIHGCKPPVVGDIYMGSPAIESELDGVLLKSKGHGEDISKLGFQASEDYDLVLDVQKANYIIDASSGTFIESDHGSIKCDGSRFISRGSRSSIVVTWRAPAEDASTDIQITKGPGYNRLYISTLRIHSQGVTKEDEL